MITKEMLQTVKSLALAAVLAPMLMGCPKDSGLSVGYEGVYRGGDGVELQIVAGPFKSGAQLTLPGGKKLVGKATEYSYDTLAAGKPGYLSRPIVKGSNMYEAFLVMPRGPAVTKGDTILLDTDVAYLRYDSKQEGTIQTITITYSSKGIIQLDSKRREIERGAPSKECRKDCNVAWEEIVAAPDYNELQLTRVPGAEPKIEFPSQ